MQFEVNVCFFYLLDFFGVVEFLEVGMSEYIFDGHSFPWLKL
jgi:hypothetical protein